MINLLVGPNPVAVVDSTAAVAQQSSDHIVADHSPSLVCIAFDELPLPAAEFAFQFVAVVVGLAEDSQPVVEKQKFAPFRAHLQKFIFFRQVIKITSVSFTPAASITTART